jgi:outer membrane receptor protein involved in Fe transport
LQSHNDVANVKVNQINYLYGEDVTPTRRLPRSAGNPLIAAAVATALGLPATGIAADNPGDLQEVVVTANRREQNVLDVPYNISTVTNATLENSGASSLTDIARLLPGVAIPDLGARANSSNSLIIIRGLNINDPVASSYLPWGSVPTVSTYIDDVPLFVNLKLEDIQRIEVLRGPQGTLYGSGAVGGTVKILHNAPDPSAFAASFSADTSKTEHAENPSYAVKGMINVPLGTDLALRASAGYEKSAGFINAPNAVVFGPNQQPVLADPANPLTSGLTYQQLEHIDDARSFSLRAALKWNPSSWLGADLAYQRQDDHSAGFSWQTQGYSYETQALVPDQPEHRTVDLESLTLTADVGFATVTSSSSFSVMSVDNTYDESQFVVAYDLASPLLYGNYPRVTSLFFTTSRDTSFAQELRLVSKEGGDWDYTAGAFFQHQTQHLLQRESLPGFAAWSELPGSADAIPADTPGAAYANFGDFLQFYNGGTRPSALSPVDTNFTYLRLSGFKDRAVYGELTRHITSKWQVTGGARLFWQDFAQSLHSTIPYGGPLYSTLPPPANETDSMGSTVVEREQSFRNHIFKLNSSYEVSARSRLYATFSEGFRHGGINALSIGDCIFCESESIVPYRSDTVKNYEVGFKGTSGNWLRYSAALYREKWDDVQIQIFGQAGDPAVVNGKTARSQGVELELDAQLNRNWTATLGYGFTDAKITQDFDISEVVNGNTFNLVNGHDGDRLPYVPKQTLTADLGYAQPLTAIIALDAHVNAAYHSNVSTQLNDTVLGYRVLGGFTTVNATAGLSFGAAWRARLYVDNLTNVQGVTAAGPLLRIYDDPRYRAEYVSRPRTIGMEIDYKY